MSSYHVVFTGTVIYETMYYREIDEEEECMVKGMNLKAFTLSCYADSIITGHFPILVPV